MCLLEVTIQPGTMVIVGEVPPSVVSPPPKKDSRCRSYLYVEGCLLLLEFGGRPHWFDSLEGDRLARLTRDRPLQRLKIIGVDLGIMARAADRDVELFAIDQLGVVCNCGSGP